MLMLPSYSSSWSCNAEIAESYDASLDKISVIVAFNMLSLAINASMSANYMSSLSCNVAIIASSIT